ncbi:MAG: hypothetical protein R3C03_18670 [Pirellulaceae bacterium]
MILAVLAIVFPLPRFVSAQTQTPLVVVLDSGDVLKVETTLSDFSWKTFDRSEGSNSSIRKIPFQDVVVLHLASSSIDEQMESIIRWLDELDAADYHLREAAEQNLSAITTVKLFEEIVSELGELTSLEMKHRLARVSNKQKSASSRAETGAKFVDHFSQLALSDGSVQKGDTGGWELPMTWQGQRWTRNVDSLSTIISPYWWSESRAGGEAFASTETFTTGGSIDGTFLDFEKSAKGSELNGRVEIDDLFSDFGVRFFADKDRHLIVSGFSFQDAKAPPKGNSICVFTPGDLANSRFIGRAMIEFCLPGARCYSGAVHEIGFYSATIDHAKDFVMKAFDVHGHVIGSVEASGDRCAYFGIKSEIPIAHVEFSANDFFFPKRWDKDIRYAIDDLTFSNPMPVVGALNRTKQTRIYLKNGELLVANEVRFGRDGLNARVEDDLQEATIGWEQVLGLTMADTHPLTYDSQSNVWMAMLRDGSCVPVKPSVQVHSSQWTNWTIDSADLIAIWSGRDALRMPIASDFDSGKNVLVFPTCRMAVPDVALTDNSMRWDRSAATIFEPDLSEDASDAVLSEQAASLPDFEAFAFVDSTEIQSPSLWYRPPKDHHQTPSVMLRSGVVYAFGENAFFQLKGFTSEGIQLQHADGDAFPIEWEQVQRIKF